MPNKGKIPVVMREFKRGTLMSGSGKKVTNPDQAVAIALHSAGMSKAGKKRRKTAMTRKAA